MTPRLNVHSANILHNAKCDMPSSDRGPLADNYLHTNSFATGTVQVLPSCLSNNNIIILWTPVATKMINKRVIYVHGDAGDHYCIAPICTIILLYRTSMVI